MRAVVSAASVLAIAAGASAAQFQFLSFEAGGGLDGVDGVGFFTSAGNFFNSGLAPGVTAGPFAFMGGFPELEFDTYVGIDPNAPSMIAGRDTDFFYGLGDYETNNTTTPDQLSLAPGGNITGGLAQVGVGISPQPFFSGFSPDGQDGVFVMRATVEPGQTVLGGGLFAVQGPGGTESAIVDLDGTTAVLDGQEVGLVAYHTASTQFGDTWDVFFQVIPTPGAIALLGIGGLTTLRRRRS